MAAFVAGVTPTALRSAASPALCGSAARPAAVAPSAAAGRVRMAFSSLDRPETSVRAVAGDLEAMDLTVRAVYKQVFGNAYLMEEELAGLAVAESQFREVHGSVREFIRDLAKSEQYKKRFFETAGPYRYVLVFLALPEALRGDGGMEEDALGGGYMMSWPGSV